MIASSSGSIRVCKFLLKNNAAVNLKDEDGHNALFYALRQKNYDICKLLIQHGIDMDNAGSNEKPILETANATDDESIISLKKLLLVKKDEMGNLEPKLKTQIAKSNG